MFRVFAWIWLALLALAGVPACGQAVVVRQGWLGKQGEPSVVEHRQSDPKSQSASQHISLKFPGALASEVEVGGQQTTRFSIPNAGLSCEPAHPELPVYRHVLVVAHNAKVTCQTTVQAAKEFALTESGLPVRLFPRQRSIRKIPGALQQAVVEGLTSEDVSAPAESPVARLVELGVQRGQRLMLLEVFPVSYDSGKGAVILREAIEVEIVTENYQGSAASTRSVEILPLNRGSRREEALTSRDGIVSGLTSTATNLVEGAPGVSARRLLIVAPPVLAASLGAFVAHKKALGWSVDSFTTEVTGSTTESIQAFIRLRYGSDATRPSHLLLVGDTDTIPAWPGKGAYQPDTDLYYACMDGPGDWLPDMAYGRFSARTAEQLSNMIARTLFYETNVAPRTRFVSRAVFITSEENYLVTEDSHNRAIARHFNPRGYNAQRLYRHTYDATTSQISGAVNAGCSMLTFSGHGVELKWRDPLFGVSDVLALSNAFLCPFVSSFACDTGAYAANDECFAEAWLRKAGAGGAIAVLASSQDTYWEEDDTFETAVFDALFEDKAASLGDMMALAKNRYLAIYGPSSETLQYFEQYNLFGDPTLALVVLDGTTIVDTDHDGIPDNWEIQFGLNPMDAADAGQDWDADGMVNLHEYLADTSPTNRVSVLRILGVNVSARGLTVHWVGGVESTQYLERCDASFPGSPWLCIYTNLPPTGLTNTFEDTLRQTNSFYRVRVAR